MFSKNSEIRPTTTTLIKNIVLEGGGVTAFAYAGALEIIEKYGLLDGLENAGGSSAGAMVSLLVAFNYSAKEIKNIITKEVDFTKLMDSRHNWDPKFFTVSGMSVGLSNFYALFKYKGFYKGDVFKQLIKKFIATKTEENLKKIISPDQNIEQIKEYFYIDSLEELTFGQLAALRSAYPELKLKGLYVMGTRLSDASALVFCEETHPNMSIADAVRISMSFPGGFEPVYYQGHYYSDGGIADNYPMSIFDKEKFSSCGLTENQINPCTLGFLVDSAAEIEARWGGKIPSGMPFSLQQFSKQILSSLHNRAEILQERYNFNSVQIFNEDINATEFSITPEKIQKLIQSGAKAARHYIDNANLNFPLQSPPLKAAQLPLIDKTDVIKNIINTPIKTNLPLDPEYTNKLKRAAHKLSLGHWDDHLTLETPGDFAHNQKNVTYSKNGESTGKKLTDFSVISKSHPENAVQLHVLIPQQSKPSPENTLIIILKDLQSYDPSYGAPQHLANFKQYQDNVIKHTRWGLRKIQNANPTHIIIHSDEKTAQDANHLQSVLISELSGSTVSEISLVTQPAIKPPNRYLKLMVSTLKPIPSLLFSVIKLPFRFLNSIYTQISSYFAKPPNTPTPDWYNILINQPIEKNTIQTNTQETLEQKIEMLDYNTRPAQRLKREGRPPIQNILFEGGGINSLVYIGALQSFENQQMLSDLRRIGGSSMSAAIATLMAIGSKPTEIKRLMLDEIKLETLADKPFSLDPDLFTIKGAGISLSSLLSLYKNQGIYKGDAFKKLFAALLAQQLSINLKTALFTQLNTLEKSFFVSNQSLSPSEKSKVIDKHLDEKLNALLVNLGISNLSEIRFGQLSSLSQHYPDLIKDLYLTGTRLEDASLMTFCADNTPDMPILEALRIAVSFVGGFYPIKNQGIHYAGGAIADNYPMHIFDKTPFLTYGRNEAGVNPCTLGLLVESEEEINGRWGIIKEDKPATQFKLEDYAANIINGMHNRPETLRDKYNINSIQINDQDIEALDLGLNKDQKLSLLESGQKAGDQYYANYMGDISGHIQYSSLPDYTDFAEKYKNKKIPELNRILSEEILPALDSIADLHKQIKNTEHELELKQTLDNIHQNIIQEKNSLNQQITQIKERTQTRVGKPIMLEQDDFTIYHTNTPLLYAAFQSHTHTNTLENTVAWPSEAVKP